ncbi:protein FLX-like 3 isoform X2 [Dioscorea cayenensis subsp. rotundata]|uniref:Protein FLX-like 3 isoform X2 n=1 Tax=Dioscorea cayennensis subsp. rotundata TaxID=55577 RepID=A0AB40AI18_DIOCR|nr:protein FLX-like 3 isoform X2 [Dioscorea cayenensis subsp. rotundata]
MAGRGHGPRHVMNSRRGHPNAQEVPFIRGPAPRPPHPVLLEEELELQHIEIQRLLADNHRLADDRAGMQREVGVLKEELHHMNIVIADLKAEKEAQCRELLEKVLKLEADVRASEPLRNEAIQLRKEVQKLNVLRQDLTGQVNTLTKELAVVRSDNQQIPHLRSEIEGLQQELMHIRRAFEYEKTRNVELMEHRQTMEKNMVSMAREIEMLRTNMGNAERRPMGGGRAYGMNHVNPEGAYPLSFGSAYNPHSAGMFPVWQPLVLRYNLLTEGPRKKQMMC